MKKAALFLLVLILVALAGLVVWRESARPSAGFAFKPASLEVQTARQITLPRYLEAVGQVVSVHSVAIRPQVSGMLEQVGFAEGADVKKGQLLFRIDAAPFKAKLLGAKAAFEAARQKAQRTQALLAKHYVTAQDALQAQAGADQAQAAYQTAKINLGYTQIRSPIKGRAGLVSVKSGNLVATSDAPLVTIKQMQPIDVQFSLPQARLDTIRRYRHHQGGLVVVALKGDSGKKVATGKLAFLANQIDPKTATFTLKARFSNRQKALWPGQFVNVRVVLEQQRVLAIPAVALQVGQQGHYVYQVKAGKTVVTPVTLVREQGRWAIIGSGLAVGDAVVTRVPRNLRVGMPATTHQAMADAVSASASSHEAAVTPQKAAP